MKATRGTARLAGVLYLLLAITGFYNLMLMPGALVVPGDAAATARNIAATELTYRVGILSGLVSEILFLFLGLTLYVLLKEVDRYHARLMVLLVTVAVVLGVVDLSFQAAPLVLLSGADFLSVFPKPRLDALALGFWRLHGTGIELAMAFWGLWLLPFGILVIKSGWFPKVLGVLLIVGCFGYLIVGFTWILFPAHGRTVNQVMMPFYSVGELAMIVWLLVRGAAVKPLEARPVA